MVKVPKRASKRQTTKQRVKVQKKVKEHHRKQRRDAKRNPNVTWKSKKKADPGIPNSFPFKEQLLDEIMVNRAREEERKRERDEERRKRQRGEVVDEDDEDDEDDEEQEEDVEAELEESAQPLRKLVAPVYTGSLEDLLDDEQVKQLVFCLDARDPLAWRCTSLEQAATAKGKKVVLAVTKADLVPFESLVTHLHALSGGSDPSSSTSAAHASVHPISAASPASVTSLLKELKAGATAILGFENSGRTALATLLLNAQRETKVFDTSHLMALGAKSNGLDDEYEEEEDDDEEDDEDEDASEILAFTRLVNRSRRVLLRNKGHVEKIKDPLPLLYALITLIKQNEDLMLLYNVPAFGSHRPSTLGTTDEGLTEGERSLLVTAALNEKVEKDTEEFLIGLARAQGRTMKKGIPDVRAAARVVLRDWSAGCVAYHSVAPGWTGLAKADRERITASWRTTLSSAGLGETSLPRKEWRRTFVEAQKSRRDLHPGPAIGEVRLKSASEIAGGSMVEEGQELVFWQPREVVAALDEDEDEDEDLDEEEEELELEVGSEDDEDDEEEEEEEDEEEDEEEEDEEEEEEEEESQPIISLKALRQQSSSTNKDTREREKKRVRVVEPPKSGMPSQTKKRRA